MDASIFNKHDLSTAIFFQRQELPEEENPGGKKLDVQRMIYFWIKLSISVLEGDGI